MHSCMVIYRQLESIMFRYMRYTLLILIGCEDNFTWNPLEKQHGYRRNTSSILSINDGRLPMDENGFYHLTIDTTNWQVLHRVSGFITDSTTNSVVNCRLNGNHHTHGLWRYFRLLGQTRTNT